MPYRLISQVVLAVGRIEQSGVKLLGTCFAIEKGKFATTKHVVGINDDNLVIILPRNQNILEYQDTSDTSINYMQANIAEIDPFKDICILSTDVGITPNYLLTGTDNIPPGSPVITFGFPHADHGRLVLTQQNARVGARVLIESAGIKSKYIILNTQARPGQSGSPVINPADMSIVAILIGSYAPGGGGGISLGGVDPHTLHQTTHAISAEYIKEMV